MIYISRALLVVALTMAAGTSESATITQGFTYAVANGDHFHSSTAGSFGNPAGKAEVGRYSTEIVKGLSEYNLTGLTAATSAFVTFNVFRAGGLFVGTNGTPFSGTIAIVAYRGNNTEDLSDFSAPSVGSVGSFFISPATSGAGAVYSFDITSIFNAAISNGWNSLGIRLEQNPVLTASQAWTFDTFRLTTDNLTAPVPEPAAWAMLLGGFGVVGAVARTRRAVAFA